MNYEVLRGFVRQEVERVTASRKHNRLAKVTSYDPKKYAVKVQFWPYKESAPNDSESGWIPLEVSATGNGFGVYNAPNVGDLGEIDFSGSDHMTGRFRSRHVTEQHEVPYEIPAGEYHTVHKSGAVIRMKKDGSVFIGGAGTVPPPQNNPNSQSNTGGNAPDQATQQGQQPQAKQAITLDKDGNITIDTPNGKWTQTNKGEVTFKSNESDVTMISSAGKVYAVKSGKGSAKRVMLEGGALSSVLYADP